MIRRRWPWIVGIIAAFIIGILVGGSGGTTTAASDTAPVETILVTPKAEKDPVTESKPTKKSEPAKPKTVLDISGNGINTTKTFTVEGDWDLEYSYDCSSSGFEGVFQVWLDGGIADIYANSSGMSGEDVTHQHDGAGDMALEINSTCDWTIKVIDLP